MTEQSTPQTSPKESLQKVIEIGAGDDLVGALDFVLSQPRSPEQFSYAIQAVATLMSPDEAYDLLTWFVSLDRTDKVASIEQLELAPDIRVFVRRIAMRHAALLREARNAWTFYPRPDDWDSISDEVSFSNELEEYNVALIIRKRNGEISQITGSQDSIVRLATRLLATLEGVDNTSFFDREDAERLFAQVDTLRASLASVEGNAASEEDQGSSER